jgi:hypothetical protein
MIQFKKMSFNLKSTLSRFLIELVLIISTFFLTLVTFYPLVIPIALLLLCHRWIVVNLAKWRHKDWIPTSMHAGSVCLDPTNEEKLYTFGFSFEIEQLFNHQEFIDRIETFLNLNKVIIFEI